MEVISASAYEKLYKNFILPDFPEISDITVTKSSFWKKVSEFGVGYDFTVNVYLKKYDQQGIDSCVIFGKKITNKVIDLNKYFGEQISQEIRIYEGDKLICKSGDFYVGKA